MVAKRQSTTPGGGFWKAVVDWKKKKKKHNLKVVSYVLFGDLPEDYSLGGSLSALRNCSKEVREESDI